MGMYVNSLAEVDQPNADGFIFQFGHPRDHHPLASMDLRKFGKEMGEGEWFIETDNQTDQMEFVSSIDQEIDHDRLPAFGILTENPKEASEATVVYLDNVETEDQVVLTLREAVVTLRDINENSGPPSATQVADRLINRRTAEKALNLSASVVSVVTFVV